MRIINVASMHWLLFGILLCVVPEACFAARIAVFYQAGFPFISTEPMGKETLTRALRDGNTVSFFNSEELNRPNSLSTIDLLVLPYGSAFPLQGWQALHQFIEKGGRLLILGGQPFRTPVSLEGGRFVENNASDAYSRELGVLHTYQAPQPGAVRFVWRDGFEFLGNISVHARKSFVLEGHGLNGLGYFLNTEGERVAAPVVVQERARGRYVYLDFQPEPGYWNSSDGIALIKAAAAYASAEKTFLSLEMQFSTVRKGETPLAIVHVRQQKAKPAQVRVDLSQGDTVITTERLSPSDGTLDSGVVFPNALNPGFYIVRATYSEGGRECDFYENGFWVEDRGTLTSGPTLGVKGDFFTKNGKPFFPFGSNYFSTESNGWDFSGPRNAAVWERDFAEMERHGITFVRTGVWDGQFKIVEGPEGAITERFLRNVEAFLLCARHHDIAVNFTFFAFDPQSTLRQHQAPVMSLPGTNPYLDPVTVTAEQEYMLAIVNRFKDVPYLCWDLINEPSFSNPHHPWRGNTPNDDPAELGAWREWLGKKYGTIGRLAAAWSVTPDQLGSFDSIALPPPQALTLDLENNHNEMARAYDYNLFAQDSFSAWVHGMVQVIRSTGSRQLIDVGQDEGGVENRVLNQFYGTAGVSFTTNHTYRANQSLLWDSLAAKVPGIPNIVGETGYQPVTYPNGDWHFDEITGFGLIERKWAAGFAGGTSGALSWDWDREIYFGLLRSDGSQKTWIDMARAMGQFAKKAAAEATDMRYPDIAIVLPQSLQLSVFNHVSIQAQQECVRALYGYARGAAYAVGEYQLDRLGNPKLIIVPSPWVLSEDSWKTLRAAVSNGATLLISGRFDLDPHFNATDRCQNVGIPCTSKLLDTIDNSLELPGGDAFKLVYLNNETDYLQKAVLPDGQTFFEKPLGKGKVLFPTLPLELNANSEAIGKVYLYAMKEAGVRPVYSTRVADPGLLICPTVFPHATLYVISSETTLSNVQFRDERSSKEFSRRLDPGRAALLLVSDRGEVLASYNW